MVVDDGAVRLPDGTLAGSAASLAGCVERLWRATGCSLAEALGTATEVPARVIGEHGRGRLAVGCRADLALWEQDPTQRTLRPVTTMVGGAVVHDARAGGGR